MFEETFFMERAFHSSVLCFSSPSVLILSESLTLHVRESYFDTIKLGNKDKIKIYRMYFLKQ